MYALLSMTSTYGMPYWHGDRDLLHEELERVVPDDPDDEVLRPPSLTPMHAGTSQPSGPAWPQHR